MSLAMFRAVVGPISPVRVDEEAPVPYRLSASQQMAMKGSKSSEPSEGKSPITNDPTKPPSFPS